MGENPQEIWQEVARWQQETGYSLEAVYNTPHDESLEGLSEEKRKEGVELWNRYQAAGGGFGSDVG